MRVGVCGVRFGRSFLNFLAAHPYVDGIAAADLDTGVLDLVKQRWPDATIYSGPAGVDDLCADPTLDAIAIFTPPWLHAEHSLKALRAGKHVMCAVPAALTLEDLHAVVAEVERTGLCYTMAETSTYKPSFLYCRERYRRGDFGRFMYGDAQYVYHPSHYIFWTRDYYANFPPMLYASHSVAHMAGITGGRLNRVAAVGFGEIYPDFRDRKRLDMFPDDDVSAETALFTLDNGGTCRITEARWIGFYSGSHTQFTVYGTDASFQENLSGHVWTSAVKKETKDITADLMTFDIPWENWQGRRSPAHPKRELPELYSTFGNGHVGSHAFLVDDFVRYCHDGRRAFNDVWQSARFCAPGIVAHQSARKDGEWLEVPDFGTNPDGPWQPDELDEIAYDLDAETGVSTPTSPGA